MDNIDREGANNSYRKSYFLKNIKKGFYKLSHDKNILDKGTDKINITNNITKPNITTLNGFWNSNITIDKKTNKVVVDTFFNFDDDDFNIKQINNILGDFNLFEMRDKCYYILPELATKEKLKYYNCDMYNINDNIMLEDINLYYMKTSNNYIYDYIYNKKFGNGIYLEYFDFNRIIITTETTKGYLLLCRKKTNITYYISAFTLPKNSIIVIPKNTIHSDCFIYGDIITNYNICIKYSTALLQYYENIVKFNIITI